MRTFLAAAVLALTACAKQDAALLVNFKGAYRIPLDADTLSIDVRDGTAVIKHLSYDLKTLTPAPASPLNATLTFVQSGAAHAKVRIDATLTLQGQTQGQGRTDATFEDGQTTKVTVTLVPPQ